MTTLRMLSDEHQDVVREMDSLSPLIAKIVMGQVLEGMHPLNSVCIFIQRAVLPHFELEESHVFPFLLRGNQQDRQLYEELMEEHHLLRKNFTYFLELCRREEWSDEFIRVSTQMITSLISHAKKEDIVLIPLIRRVLKIDAEHPLPHAPPVLFSNS